MVALSAQAALKARIDTLYRSESRRVLATLIRLLGDFDVAEEALHDAFRAAVEQWSSTGVPDNPRAWLVSAGRFKAIDRLRRNARFQGDFESIVQGLAAADADPADRDFDQVEDDRLRLVFTCCHPALAPDAQIALTLREVCDLTTEEIARAFLVPTPTVAQRIVRAKHRLRDAGIPYEVPGHAELPQRLDSVLRVIYLVFNEGYSATAGDSIERRDLTGEAIRLARLLLTLLQDAEVMGLLALMLLHTSRRAARVGADGDLVLLPEQDRRLWDRALIAEGEALVQRAMATRRIGVYTLQAAIAAEHARATTSADTDWSRIIALYDILRRADPSPVIELNRAVAVSMRDGPQPGLDLVDALLARGELADYHLAHAARADLCERLGRFGDARSAYRRALALVRQTPERRYLEQRLSGLPSR